MFIDELDNLASFPRLARPRAGAETLCRAIQLHGAHVEQAHGQIVFAVFEEVPAGLSVYFHVRYRFGNVEVRVEFQGPQTFIRFENLLSARLEGGPKPVDGVPHGLPQQILRGVHHRTPTLIEIFLLEGRDDVIAVFGLVTMLGLVIGSDAMVVKPGQLFLDGAVHLGFERADKRLPGLFIVSGLIDLVKRGVLGHRRHRGRARSGTSD